MRDHETGKVVTKMNLSRSSLMVNDIQVTGSKDGLFSMKLFETRKSKQKEAAETQRSPFKARVNRDIAFNLTNADIPTEFNHY